MLWDWRKARSRRAALLVLVAMSLLGVSACRSPVVSPPATIHAMGWLHTDGARLVSDDGVTQRIRAVSWFGLETQTCAPHGLDTISLETALTEIAAMGFNTIRLPYSSECLAKTATTGVDTTLNPDLAGATPLKVMDRVVERAGAHQLSVILDRHRLNSAAQSDLWYDSSYPESRWLSDWTMLAKRYADNPTVIGADLQNEPHGAACWGCGDPTRDWAAAATRGGNAVLGVNPHWLILVEGVEHQTAGESTWWGGGLADARQTPITLDVPGRVVYSPHAYPPSIFAQPQFTEAGFPNNLPAYWDRTWGYLQRENLAPVLLGEFGSKLKTSDDRQWMTTMVSYLDANQMSFGYWAFNPDSTDTGGLVKKNWVTPEQAQLTALAPLFTTDLPSAGSSLAVNTLTPSLTPSSLAPASSQPPSMVETPPPETTGASPTSTSSAGTLSATWQPQSSWGEGYAVNLTLTAAGAATKGWTLSWPDPHATAIQNDWGTVCTLDSGRVACVGKDWGAWVAAGASVTVGVQVVSPAGSPATPTLTVTRTR